MTTGVILVHEKIAARVTEQLVAKASHLPVGDPATQQVALGPLISERQRDRVHGIVQDSIEQGAQLAAGGSYEGNFYKPTVLTQVKPGMRCFDEEVFGPVASIILKTAVTRFHSHDVREICVFETARFGRWSA